MDARSSFRAAVGDTQKYQPDDAARRPAYISSVARMGKDPQRDVRALPRRASSGGRAGGVVEVLARLAEQSVTSERYVRQCLEVIESTQPVLNAFSHVVDGPELLELARTLDQERTAGRLRGPLHGLPVSVKDVIHVQGMPTSCSSRVMEGYVATEDATAVRRLREAGALIMGKTHTHEFALGVTTPQSRNPWDSERDPGGSSGGSAISVATGASILSVGTDTRASIRVPASLCGIVGYKPTFGLVSTHGVVTLSWSMDHAGLQGRTTEDVALMMNTIQGVDANDYSTLDLPPQDYTDFLHRDVRGLRVGLATGALGEVDGAVMATFREAVQALASLGVEVVETAQPTAEDFRLATSLGLVLSRSEAAAYHGSLAESGPLYTEAVFQQLDEASQVKAVDYINAQRFRGEFQQRMLALISGFDALIMPTTKVAAPLSEDSGAYHIILSENCIPWSFIGFPAISVPAGLTRDGLPCGAQLVGGPFDDGIILALGSALESITPDLRPRFAG